MPRVAGYPNYSDSIGRLAAASSIGSINIIVPMMQEIMTSLTLSVLLSIDVDDACPQACEFKSGKLTYFAVTLNTFLTVDVYSFYAGRC